MENEVLFRAPHASDIPFIFDSWLRSWRKCHGAGTIRNDMYFPVQRATIEGLVGRGAQFEVACLAADPERILGWVCFELTPQNETIIHYAYTKDPYLGLGITQELIARCPGTAPGFYTHSYRQVTEICNRDSGWRHAPEIARRK